MRKVQPRQPPFFCELLISCYWFKQFSPHYQNKHNTANRDWIKETTQLRSQNGFVCIMSKRNITTCFIFIFRCTGTQSHVLFMSLITIAHFKACLCVRLCVWMGGCTEIICLNSYACGAWTPVCSSVELLMWGFNKNLRRWQSTCFITFYQFAAAPFVLERAVGQRWKKRPTNPLRLLNVRELTPLIKASHLHFKVTTQTATCCCSPQDCDMRVFLLK